MIKPIIIKPLLTEKSLKNERVYVFEVAKNAGKNALKSALQTIYKVKIGKIRTVILPGKVKTVSRKRLKKQLPAKKKAYVYLTEGEIPEIKVK